MEVTLFYPRCDAELTVEGTYNEYHPGTQYDRNGDPGDPPEGGDFDLDSVKIGGVDVTELLSKEAIAWLANAAAEKAAGTEGGA